MTYLRNSTGFIFGQNTTTYSTATGQMIPSGIRFENVLGVCRMYFYSNSLGAMSSQDSRIVSVGGTAIGGQGALTIGSGTINITSALASVNLTATTTGNITAPSGIVLTSPNTQISQRGINKLFVVTDGEGMTNTYMDFYSSGLNAYSSRIISNGGTSTNGNGDLGIQSGTITLSPTTSTTINKQVSLGWIQTSTTPCYTNINTVNGQCNIDFHSSGLNNVGYD